MKTNSSFHAAGEVATQPAWGTGEQAAQPLNGSTSRFAMSESSLADLLQKAASQYPNRAAYKFIDYDTDPAGFTETVTWWQVHRRAMIVAEELWIYASSGDRVAILAPQGLEYIIAFMGVLQAGLIAVPLPVPQFGIHDERISSALRDSAPSIILTTSSVIDEVTTYAPHACAAQGQSAPIVVAVDALDLSSSRALDPTRFERPSTAYLQYTSGSTRAPAGVVLSHKNVITNCVQLMSDYIGDSEKVPSTPVSWLPFYHDMGLMLGIILPMINQDTAVLMSPMAFLQRPARWMQLLAKHRAQISSAPNFGFELAVRRTSDDDMAGLDLGHVRTIVTGAERVNVATLRRFTERFAPFNLSETAIRPSYGLAEATVYVATAGPGRAPKSVCFDYQQLSVGQAKRAENGSEGANLVSYGASPGVNRADRRPRNQDGESRGDGWRNLGAGRQRRLGLLAQPAADGGDVPRAARHSLARDFGRSVAADRRPRRHFRGRTVHHGSHQGAVGGGWGQPLSGRHRGDDPGNHRRPGCGDCGAR